MTIVFPLIFALLTLVSASSLSAASQGRGTDGGLTGRLLVAASLEDPRFQETVIYIVKHDRTGAMGLVVNRPAGRVNLGKILRMPDGEALPGEWDLLVYYGGPVQLDRGFLLHSTDVVSEASEVVAEGVAFTSDPALLRRIAEGNGPQKYIFTFGYAGWAPRQLEAEIETGAWLIRDADETILFAEDPSETWRRLTGKEIFRL